MIKVFIKDWKIIKTINWPFIGQEFEPEADIVIETEDFEIHQNLEFVNGELQERVIEEPLEPTE
jgi:hypothetical protein